MKPIFIYLFMTCFIAGVYANEPVDRVKKSTITQVKYKVVEKTYILPQENLSTETLSILDKANFKDKEYINKYVRDFDNEHNVRTQTLFVSQKNKFSNWYPHPYKTVNNIDGITSYFTPSSYRSLHIDKKEDKYVSRPIKSMTEKVIRDDDAQQAYEDWNQKIQEKGLLHGLIFEMPTKEMLQDIKHSIDKNGNIIASFEDMSITWNPQKKIIVEKYFENGKLVATERKIFRYNKKFKEILLKKLVVSDFSQFSNGNDYKRVEIHSYEDYELSGEDVIEDNEVVFSLSPNPADKYTIAHYPQLKEDAILTVYDTNGKLLLQRKIDKGSTEYYINLNEIAQGMLFITISNNQINYTQKIIKL